MSQAASRLRRGLESALAVGTNAHPEWRTRCSSCKSCCSSPVWSPRHRLPKARPQSDAGRGAGVAGRRFGVGVCVGIQCVSSVASGSVAAHGSRWVSEPGTVISAGRQLDEHRRQTALPARHRPEHRRYAGARGLRECRRGWLHQPALIRPLSEHAAQGRRQAPFPYPPSARPLTKGHQAPHSCAAGTSQSPTAARWCRRSRKAPRSPSPDPERSSRPATSWLPA